MKVMKRSQLTADILETRLGGYPAFIGVVRKNGKIVWRGVHVRNQRDWASEDAERGLATMTSEKGR